MNTHADWAVRYISQLGLALVPIPAGTKAPRTADWNKPGNYHTDPDRAKKFWEQNPRYGMGAVLGPSKIVTWDVDHPEYTQLLFAELGLDYQALTEGVPRIQGNPARDKFVFRAPAEPLSRHALAWPKKADGEKPTTVFELRAGDVQDVLPPSIHPDQKAPYQWLVAPSDGFPALPELLLRMWTRWDTAKPRLLAACPWADKPKPARAREKPSGGEGPSVIEAFNVAHDMGSLLEAHGYKRKGNRYLAPQSSSGLPGVTLSNLNSLCYSHHSADPLADGHAHDAFDVYCLLDHNGDKKAAAKAAADLLGLKKPRRHPARARASSAQKKEDSTSFDDYVTQITGASELDVLIDDLATRIHASESLDHVRKKLLLQQIAKKVGVSVRDLKRQLTGADPAAQKEYVTAEPVDKVVNELNKRHAVVPVGGKVVILNQEYDPNLNRPMLTFSGSQDFVLRYSNRQCFHRGASTDIGTAWLYSPQRRQYHGIIFAPGKKVPGYYNLFQGFGVKPKPGSYGRFEDLVQDVICGGNDTAHEYVWMWLAHLFQRPAELPGTALVLRGKQGTGKNTFSDTIGTLVGHQHYIAVNSLQQITGRFSGHLADTMLVFANEAIWGGDKPAEGALKAMITDSLALIERKGKDAVSLPNYKRLIVASNEDWVVPRGLDDRRFVVLDISDEHKEDKPYFSAIKQELENGGYEALMQALLAVDLSEWHPSNIPKALKQKGWELKLMSASSGIKWWHSCLDAGVLLPNSDQDALWPLSPDHQIPKSKLYHRYTNWCREIQERRTAAINVFSKDLKRCGILTVRPRFDGQQQNCYDIPDLDQARRHFSETMNLPADAWEPDKA